MAEETWNYIGSGLHQTARILSNALRASVGTSIKIAPLDDKTLMRIGVWLRGEPKEMTEVRERLDKNLQEKKIKYSALQWGESSGR